MRISQILCAAGPVDAVTNQAVAWRQRFQTWGWDGHDYVANVAPGVTPSHLGPWGSCGETASRFFTTRAMPMASSRWWGRTRC